MDDESDPTSHDERAKRSPERMDPGRDTPTGTDPDAKYTAPGYEDVSFGQAVQRDAELAERIAEETGDADEAEERFEHEATGSPKFSEQHER